MSELTCSREKTLGLITLVLGSLIWVALVVGTVGVVLVALLLSFFLYLFAQSALISYIKGNAIALSEEQLPDLYQQFKFCCDRLQIEERPEAYVLNGNGGLNAFATKFLGNQYVVVYSEVVDAMSAHQDGIQFYFGHELGHLKRKHLGIGQLLRWPVLWLPLLGAAYSRARETTCDLHGLACSSSGENGARALAALSAGSNRWKDVRLDTYLRQVEHTSGFWMSFHELIAAYPWLSKRVARVNNPKGELPSRNFFAYLFALFVPYAGRLGGGFGVLIFVYIVAVLAAVAIPAYENYTTKAKLTQAVAASHEFREKLSDFYLKEKRVPSSLLEAGIAKSLIGDMSVELNTKNMIFKFSNKKGALNFVPRELESGEIEWTCIASAPLTREALPTGCSLEQKSE